MRGFCGFVPFSVLSGRLVPSASGIYVVVRASDSAPTFLASSTAGWRKGRDPAVSVTRLTAKWVANAEVLYVGKADSGAAADHGLRGRLMQYARHGSGGTSHHGGRYIWQLHDSAALLVAWKQTIDPRSEERALLAEFEALYDTLPFASGIDSPVARLDEARPVTGQSSFGVGVEVLVTVFDCERSRNSALSLIL